MTEVVRVNAIAVNHPIRVAEGAQKIDEEAILSLGQVLSILIVLMQDLQRGVAPIDAMSHCVFSDVIGPQQHDQWLKALSHSIDNLLQLTAEQLARCAAARIV